MKASIINKKWILTASLLTMLGTQYSYQTSSINIAKAHSKNSGEYVLASIEDRRPALYTPDDETRPPRKPVAKTEADAGCTDNCDTPAAETTIKTEDYIKLITRLEALEKAQKETAATTEATPAPTPTATPAPAEREETELESECGTASAEETRKEKRDRLACEKKAKEEIKKEERLAKFEDRVDALIEKCDQELECLTTGFTSILSRFEGKNSIPAVKVNQQFRLALGTALSKALYSEDPEMLESTLASLQSLIQDMPEQYRGLRQTVMSAVSTKASLASNKAKEHVAAMNTAYKNQDPQAYMEAKNSADAEFRTMTYLNQSYSSSIEQSLALTSDTSAISYYQRSYVPNMKKIMDNIYGTPTTTPASPTTPITTPGGTREGRTTTSGTDKMTAQDRWLAPINNGTVTFGTSAPTTTRGGRTLPPQ